MQREITRSPVHGCAMVEPRVEPERVRHYFEKVIGPELGRKAQRASFAAYALGLLSDGDRKSCEPMAARAAGGATEAERVVEAARAKDRLCHFLAYSPWDDEAVRLAAARHAIAEFEKHAPVTKMIVDDTGFPKQGSHSVGVHRQYTGTLGKTGNCQIGVSLSVATAHEHLPIDFALYLPTKWTEDAERRAEARIPNELVFQTKIELAIGMIERAKQNGIPGEIVLADSAYGTSSLFREAVRSAGMDYGVAVHANIKVFKLDSAGHRRGDSMRADEVAERSAFRRVSWRDGTKGKMSSFFYFRRVKVDAKDGQPPAEREPTWLVMEWPEGSSVAAKFMLTTLPKRMSKKQIVCILMERWRTEKAYEEMKGELGLDHFEGRSFSGWHHHISAVIACYALVVSERRRAFPPSGGPTPARPLRRPAGQALRRLVPDDAPCDRAHHAGLAAALSNVSSRECATGAA